MNVAAICRFCGKPVLPNAIGGLCPECLLKAALASNPSAEPEFAPPPVEEVAPNFPQLEILNLIGHGGMGAVYKARHPALNRTVALKILPSGQTAANPGFAERFQREARALARLNHPNIVAVHDFGQTSGFHFLLMEFVDGVTLRSLLREGKLVPAQALRIVPQICEALQFAHDAGVVHRDIKPENVLIDRQGRVKVADFGLAKILAPDAPEHTITQAGHRMGTPHYMAPEQVEKPEQVDHRADIYSLGVVFYELLTGELPLGRFDAPSKRAQIDFRLDEVVLRALEKEPNQRFQQASHLKTEIDTVEKSPAQSRRRFHPMLVVVCLTALLALFIGERQRRQRAVQESLRQKIDSARKLSESVAAEPATEHEQSPASHPAATNQAPLRERIMALNSKSWREALATAEAVAALPPGEGFALVREHWTSVTNAESRKQFLKAFTFSAHPRLLGVLELGLLDPAPPVQSWAFAYLKSVTGLDMAENYDDAARYLASRRDWQLQDALHETAQTLSQRLRSTDSGELAADLKRLEAANLLRRGSAHLTATGLDVSLETIVTSHPAELAQAALKSASGLPLPAEWFQRVATPLLQTNHPSAIRIAAAQSLSQSAAEWAVQPLLGSLGDLSNIDGAQKTSLAFAVGSALAKTGSKEAIGPVIEIMARDNSYATLYGLGYFALTPLTGVNYNQTHDAAWWTNWWEKNQGRYGLQPVRRLDR